MDEAFDLAYADQVVEQTTAWILQASERLQPVHIAERIQWQRDGLREVWERIETLKLAHAELTVLAEGAEQCTATVRDLLVQVRGAHDDTVGAGIESVVSTQAARGMAADERRIAHDTRALPLTIRRRRLERCSEQIDGLRKRINLRLYRIRDERSDLRVQLRAIDVGLEIGEL